MSNNYTLQLRQRYLMSIELLTFLINTHIMRDFTVKYLWPFQSEALVQLLY